ncbi:MAG TPA: glycosyltransferase family 39 protein, partial [Thermoanaerobaculia bacterium]|nr:glycosyltransferase family 39 protein [Thermoanaerobaculia bacterium]
FRGRFLSGLVMWGALVAFIAESASALGRYERWPVAASWAVALLAIAVIVGRRRSSPQLRRGSARPASDGLLVGGALVILILVGVTAIAAPPNTWDALTYHMPRVAHWIQNHTVAHYPTAIIRQLYLPPWSEFAISQFQLLSEGDRFANLIQWLAFAGSAVAVSRIAAQLGAGVSGQILSAVIAVSMPMAILQGSSAQTDLVTSLWILIFVSEVLDSRTREWRPTRILVIGGSLGLGVLTKPTAGIFALPFLTWLVVIGFRRFRQRAAASLLGCAGVVLALLAPHAARNIGLFGSPLGISSGVVNETFGARALFSNLARNLALEAGTPFPAANRLVEKMVSGLHRTLAWDIDDPRTTWRGSRFHVPPAPLGGAPLEAEESLYSLFHEDTASNPIHAALAVAAVGILIARPSLRARGDLLLFAAALAPSLLIFCAALKWQPWHSRLHLPLLLLAAPLSAVVWSEILAPRMEKWLAVLLLAAALPWVFANATRPLLGSESVLTTGRIAQYFSVRPPLERPYEEAARAVAASGCGQIGLAVEADTPEYLLWALLRQSLPAGSRIEHVGVTNVSRARETSFPAFSPCVLVTVETRPEGQSVRVDRFGTR